MFPFLLVSINFFVSLKTFITYPITEFVAGTTMISLFHEFFDAIFVSSIELEIILAETICDKTVFVP